MVDALSPFDAPGKLPKTAIKRPKAVEQIPRVYSRYGISVEEFKERIQQQMPYDMVFITSSMSYWYEGVIEAISIIKNLSPNIPVILGGIYATLWPNHAQTHSGADLISIGPIQQNSNKICEKLSIPKHPLRPKKKWYELGLHDDLSYSATRTATGCPFNCTYCGSRQISGPFQPFNPESIFQELAFLHKGGVRQIAFYDDALLVNFETRLKVVLDKLEQAGIEFEFHTPNGLHASLITPTVAKYFKRHGFKTIKLSLETASAARQKATGGKVTCRALEEAVQYLIAAGIDKKDIGIYLLAGLPDQDAQEVADSIIFVNSLGVRPYLSEFSPIPATPEWEKLKKQNIITDDFDPILTNNTIFFRLFSKITEKEWQMLNRLRLNQ